MNNLRDELIGDERQILDNMMDKFEDKLRVADFLFSQRHRLRWWAVRGIKFWIKENRGEKIEFT